MIGNISLQCNTITYNIDENLVYYESPLEYSLHTICTVTLVSIKDPFTGAAVLTQAFHRAVVSRQLTPTAGVG